MLANAFPRFQFQHISFLFTHVHFDIVRVVNLSQETNAL